MDRKIVVIMLSALGDTKYLFAAQELGVCDYIIKPFEAKELLNTIARCLVK